MKKIIVSILLIVCVFNYSCRKEDNPILPELQGNIPVAKLVADPNSELVIDMTKDPATFAGKFDVGLLYPNDQPQKMDVVVTKNGDRSNVKTIKTDVSAFPTTLQISGSQLIALFGSPIVLGDYFDIAADITLASGQKLFAFPANGVQYASGISAIPGSAPLLRYSAICKFDADEYAGDFVVVEDEWGDYVAGETLVVSKIDETHISFLYKADDAKPIILNITPTNAVVVTKQVYGSYPPFGTFSVETVGDINDVVKPCEGTISVLLKHSVGGGSGEYRITMKKK
jgi:hypothetical protein